MSLSDINKILTLERKKNEILGSIQHLQVNPFQALDKCGKTLSLVPRHAGITLADTTIEIGQGITNSVRRKSCSALTVLRDVKEAVDPEGLLKCVSRSENEVYKGRSTKVIHTPIGTNDMPKPVVVLNKEENISGENNDRQQTRGVSSRDQIGSSITDTPLNKRPTRHKTIPSPLHKVSCPLELAWSSTTSRYEDKNDTRRPISPDFSINVPDRNSSGQLRTSCQKAQCPIKPSVLPRSSGQDKEQCDTRRPIRK